MLEEVSSLLGLAAVSLRSEYVQKASPWGAESITLKPAIDPGFVIDNKPECAQPHGADESSAGQPRTTPKEKSWPQAHPNSLISHGLLQSLLASGGFSNENLCTASEEAPINNLMGNNSKLRENITQQARDLCTYHNNKCCKQCSHCLQEDPCFEMGPYFPDLIDVLCPYEH